MSIVRVNGQVFDIPQAERGFHRYSSDQRTNMAASFRLGYQQRRRVGEAFWTHSFVPDVCFSTRGEALRAAIRAIAQPRVAA